MTDPTDPGDATRDDSDRPTDPDEPEEANEGAGADEGTGADEAAGATDPEDAADDAFAEARDRMIERLRDRGYVEHESSLAALRAVPRHAFVPEGSRRKAYRDEPLPIGEGQTVSAPHMVGHMLDLLDLREGDRVLEIGTGCGYHAAATTEIVGAGNVYSVEYHAELAEEARATLADLGYDAHVRVGDGHEGWPEHAPYDAAYLTCAPPEIPDAVVEQVRPGGYVVGPVGRGRQELVRLRRREDGSAERERHGGVRFVPMRGGD